MQGNLLSAHPRGKEQRRGGIRFFYHRQQLLFIVWHHTRSIFNPFVSMAMLLRQPSDIAYTVKVSRRVRSVRLKISPHEGLVVVIPEGYDKALVQGIVEERREWISKVQHSFDIRRVAGLSYSGEELPSLIVLQAIGETWRVLYRHEGGSRISLRESGADELLIAGQLHEQWQCRQILDAWLKRRAEMKLVPQLFRLAAIHGFKVSNVSVRKQRSRWGSCSSRGTISLNLRLMFLPPQQVRYIMFHELCHTLHMNHSRNFWAALRRFDPDCAEHDREMAHAWRFVPGWAVAGE